MFLYNFSTLNLKISLNFFVVVAFGNNKFSITSIILLISRDLINRFCQTNIQIKDK